MNIKIRISENLAEMHQCAQLMISSNPWIKLGIDFENAIKILDNNNTERYVGIKANDIIGFIDLKMSGPLNGYIENICIEERWRNSGFGSKLLDYAEHRILETSRNVFLCVSSFNGRAQNFFFQHGFSIIGELKNYIVFGYSEILMRKTNGPIFNSNK